MSQFVVLQCCTNDTDAITPAPLVSQNAQKRRTRGRNRLAIRNENDPKQIYIQTYFKWNKVKLLTPNTLDKVLMHHQRGVQELWYEPGSKVLKQGVKQIQTSIRDMKNVIHAVDR